MKKERILSIDSLKGIACLVIAFLWHYLNMQPKGQGMPLQSVFGIFYDYGQYFVELFFMISGFVMAYCYKDKIMDGEDFLPYIVKRYKHLYPTFFTTLMFMTVMEVFYNAITGSFYVYKVSVWHFILNLLCIQTGWLTTDQSFNGPAWCISVEIFLYILFYIATKFSKNDKNIYVIINGILFVFATVMIYLGGGSYPILNMFMMRGVSCFFAGVLLCELNDWLETDLKQKIANGLLIGLVVFRFALHFSTYSFWENESTGRLCLILFEWPIILFGVINCLPLRKVMEIRPLQFLGSISMDIFLWHVPVQITIKTIDKVFDLGINYGSIGIWLIYIIAVLVAATISHIISHKMQRSYYLAKAVLSVGCCAVVLIITDVTGVQMKAILNNSLSYSDMSSVITCDPGTVLAEDFYVSQSTNIEKIQFYTITWGRNYAEDQSLQVAIKNKDTGEELYSVGRWLNYFSDRNYYDLVLDEKVALDADTWYQIEFSTNTVENQETMALMLTNNSNNGGETYVNCQESDQHISAKIWTKQ